MGCTVPALRSHTRHTTHLCKSWASRTQSAQAAPPVRVTTDVQVRAAKAAIFERQARTSRAISFSARAQTSSKLQESRLKDLRKGTEKLFILAEWQNVLQIFTGKSWLLSFRLILNDFLKVRRSCHFRRAIHRNQHHQNVLPFDPAGRDIWQSALPPHLSTTIGWIGCYCRLPKR